MAARELFYRKVILAHRKWEETAVAELKVWKIPISRDYPEGLKFSLFLVSKTTGKILIGIDNHKPKGPHLHKDEEEIGYNFKSVSELIDDFWDMVLKEGFEI